MAELLNLVEARALTEIVDPIEGEIQDALAAALDEIERLRVFETRWALLSILRPSVAIFICDKVDAEQAVRQAALSAAEQREASDG